MSDRDRQFWHSGKIRGVVFVAIVATYARSLVNGPVWDDLPLVIDNPHLRTWHGLVTIFSSIFWSASAQAEPSSFYRPLAMLTFWVSAMTGGHSAASFRFGNILIHAANAVLIATLVRKMKAASWPAAAAIALVWGLAPICSEPVLWISGRFDLIAVTFALFTLLASRVSRPWRLPLTLIAIGCGILSKETFIAWLPVVAIDDLLLRGATLEDVAAQDRRRAERDLIVKYAAIITLVIAYFLVRWSLALPSAAVALQTGVRGLAQSFLFLVATFLRVLFWPASLDPFRPYAPLSAAGAAFTLFLLSLLTGAAAAGWYTRRKSPAAKVVFLGWAWFVLATLPSALVGPNLEMVGDRYAYLPLVGFFLVVAALVGWLESHVALLANRAAWLRAGSAGALAIVACEIWVTAHHFADWHDDSSLAESSLANSPGNAYALYSLGSMAAQRDDLAKADVLLAEALDRDSRSWRTWNAICFVRLHQDRLDEAEHACREGLARRPENPRGWVNLASIYVRRGNWSGVSVAAERAVALKSRYGEGRYLAAAAAANLGKMDLARDHLARGIEAEPDNLHLRDLERQFQTHPR